jgi:hypothetical protein
LRPWGLKSSKQQVFHVKRRALGREMEVEMAESSEKIANAPDNNVSAVGPDFGLEPGPWWAVYAGQVTKCRACHVLVDFDGAEPPETCPECNFAGVPRPEIDPPVDAAINKLIGEGALREEPPPRALADGRRPQPAG